MSAKKKPGRSALKGPARALRAIGGGATTTREVAKKARLELKTAGVYIWRHQNAGLVERKGDELRLTAAGRAKVGR